MTKSKNYGFNLPSRDTDDIADINQITRNFEIIDEELYAVSAEAGEAGGIAEEARGYAARAYELVGEKASAITSQASGNVITFSDSSDLPLRDLKVYGKTTQESTPSPENPQDLESPTEVVVKVMGSDVEDQTLALPILNEVDLAGVPVASGGNYTDNNGQQWVCDEVDFARGVYVQRVGKTVLNGTETWAIFEGTRDDNTDWYYSLPKLTDAIDEGDGKKIICDRYPTNSISNNTTRQGIALVWRNVRIRWGAYSEAKTIDEWKAHLAESPLTIQYVLAEPVEIPLDEATLSAFSALHTNKPNTTITNNAGVWMSAEYVADTKLYIDNKFAELAKVIVSNS